MDAKEFRNELRRGINICLLCKNINIDESTISHKIDSYIKDFIQNVSVDGLECVLIKIEKIELETYYFELTFSFCFLFKNDLTLHDTMYMLADRK